MRAESQEVSLDDPTLTAENGGYLMIENIEIQHFRCFRHLKPLGLKRFNVLVGDSGSGKTSLMEAIFLHGGASPEIYFRIRNWRGFTSSPTFSGTQESWEILFRDMFYAFDLSKTPRISSVDSSTGRRDVDIYFRGKETLSLSMIDNQEHAFFIRPIVFKWTVNGKVYESSIEREGDKFTFKGFAPVSPIVFFHASNNSMQQATAAFSSISRRFQQDALIREVHNCFPEVEDVNIEVIGGEPVIHVSNGMQERLPVGDASGGMLKFVSIALGILANPYGVVMVDEIESGFHYKTLPAIWESLIRLCQSNEAQLIVSTHSYEFLKSIVGSLEDPVIAKDFQLLRMSNDLEMSIKRVKGTDYVNAIENEFEVR